MGVPGIRVHEVPVVDRHDVQANIVSQDLIPLVTEVAAIARPVKTIDRVGIGTSLAVDTPGIHDVVCRSVFTGKGTGCAMCHSVVVGGFVRGRAPDRPGPTLPG